MWLYAHGCVCMNVFISMNFKNIHAHIHGFMFASDIYVIAFASVCVCMCRYTGVCIHFFQVCMDVWRHVYDWVWTCSCMCICMCICAWIYMHRLGAHVSLHRYMFMYLFVYNAPVCFYVHRYEHICTYKCLFHVNLSMCC